MKLSIVIPALDEGEKIAGDVESACQFLERNGFVGEIIVVDDGSKDDTAEVARKAGQGHTDKVDVKVIRNENHHGKGYAVRSGIKQSNGEYVMFADSGSCVPFENVLRGLNLLATGQCDIAHGSRNLAGAEIRKDHGIYRHVCSEFFHWFATHVMNIPTELTDTQCGFKIYGGDVARRLYGQCTTDGFMFDIEIILRAIKQGYHIREFPIDWTCDPDSRLSPTRSIWRILAELIRIKAALRAEK
jgi:dolichyl-phosphate beta-glucosyltransferase